MCICSTAPSPAAFPSARPRAGSGIAAKAPGGTGADPGRGATDRDLNLQVFLPLPEKLWQVFSSSTFHCKKNLCHHSEMVAQELNPADKTAAHMKAELGNSFNGFKIVLSSFPDPCQGLECLIKAMGGLAISSTLGH